MIRDSLFILLMLMAGCSYTLGNRQTIADTGLTQPGRYELVNTSSNQQLAVVDVPAGQQVGMQYGSNMRQPDAAVVLSNGGQDVTGQKVVWRQELPKKGQFQWRQLP